ncbi:MAG: PEP-CTERM sorting domain-containing protein [Opitutaceae bacterium]|nr:PEP-CTERM sorting domain-containing protein [Opitutaceae bacterium]
MKTSLTLLTFFISLFSPAIGSAALEDFLAKHGSPVAATFEGVNGPSDKLHLVDSSLSSLKFTVLSDNTSLNGLAGKYSGHFIIGPVIQEGSFFRKAALTGEGMFKIADGEGSYLTGMIESGFLYDATVRNQRGFEISLDVSALSYCGSNPGLKQLKAAGQGSLLLPLDTSGLPSLSTLKSQVGYQSAAIGDGTFAFTAIPEPTTVAFVLGAASLGFVALRRRHVTA